MPISAEIQNRSDSRYRGLVHYAHFFPILLKGDNGEVYFFAEMNCYSTVGFVRMNFDGQTYAYFEDQDELFRENQWLLFEPFEQSVELKNTKENS